MLSGGTQRRALSRQLINYRIINVFKLAKVQNTTAPYDITLALDAHSRAVQSCAHRAASNRR